MQQGKYPDGVALPWLTRVDVNGDVVWQKTLPSAKWAELSGVALGPDGSSVWTGWRGQGKDFDTFTVRVDSWGTATCAASGACASIPFGSCKDGGPCATPGCDPKKGCAVIVKEDGSLCDDGKPCSVNDLCFGGACEAGDDGLWDKAYGSAKVDQFSAVAAHPDGTVVAAGRTLDTAAGNPHAWLTAVGLDGKPVWSKVVNATEWSGSASDNVVFYDVAVLPNGGALASGNHIAANPGNAAAALLYRVDAKGDKVKAATFVSPGSNYFSAVAVSDNTVWAAGRLEQNGGDGWVQALSLDTLTTASAKAIVGGSASDWLNGIALVPGGGTIAVGAKSVSGNTVGWAVRVKADGGVLWDKEFALTGVSVFYRAVPVAGGGLLLVGKTEKPGGGAASADLAIVRVNAAGTEVWKSVSGMAGYDAGSAVVPWGEGWLVAGSASPGANGIDGQLTFVNSQGGVVATKLLGGNKGDELHAMAVSGSALVLAGYTASKGAGGDDGWLVRTDPFGNATCAASGNCLADGGKCDDKNPCTADTCSAAGSCSAVKVPDGVACGANQTCKSGVCGP